MSEDSDHDRDCGTADDHYWVASAPTRTGHDDIDPVAEPDHTSAALAARWTAEPATDVADLVRDRAVAEHIAELHNARIDVGSSDVLAEAAPWIALCGSCDAGLPKNCTHPGGDYRNPMLRLVTEIEQLRARVKTQPVVEAQIGAHLAADPCGSLARALAAAFTAEQVETIYTGVMAGRDPLSLDEPWALLSDALFVAVYGRPEAALAAAEQVTAFQARRGGRQVTA